MSSVNASVQQNGVIALASSSAAPSSASAGRQPEEFIRVGKAVVLNAIKVHENHLELHYTLDATHSFLTKVLYPRGTLADFQSKFASTSSDLAHRVYCHIALVECLKFIAVFPRTLDVSCIAEGITMEALNFFTLVAGNAWGQHFHENDVRDYHGPAFIIDGKPAADSPRLRRGATAAPLAESLWKPVSTSADAPLPPILCSNGGGKDSFLAMKLLEEAGFPIHVFQHARTEYGPFSHQHSMQHGFFPHIADLKNGKGRVHEISIIDDFTDGSMMALLNPDLRGEAILGHPCQVGWPEMVFSSLPFTLTYGYAGFSLGNERSADSAQVDESTLDGGREVNHQWLKSFSACQSLRSFLRSTVAEGMEVFSLLKPLHDYRIYQLLKRYPQVLPDIHSCNIIKPWCRRCPKCAYVWINLCAIFGESRLRPIFHENLLDVPELQSSWIELLGLGDHNAFECVGEVNETRLAFYAAAEQGLEGKAMQLFKQTFLQQDENKKDESSNSSSSAAATSTDASASSSSSIRRVTVDWPLIRSKFDRVYGTAHGIPDFIFDRVKLRMLTTPGETVQ